jgi:hypothetical protein
MKNFAILFACLLISISSHSQSQEVVPKGVYAQIDVKEQNAAIAGLQAGGNEKNETITRILKDPNSFNPPVLFALSKELFDLGRKDEACHWFYIAQLRGRYDANLCLDDSASQGLGLLNQSYGPVINNYAFAYLKKLEKTVEDVVEFVKNNDEKYDHRWINLDGMKAMIAGLRDKKADEELSKPKAEWKAIKEKTIEEYYDGFLEYVKSQK